jgi:hypothetical protein
MTLTPQDQSPVAGAKLTTLGVAAQAKKSLRKAGASSGVQSE